MTAARYFFIRSGDITDEMIKVSLHTNREHVMKTSVSGWTLMESDSPLHSVFKNYYPMTATEAAIRWGNYTRRGWLVRQILLP